MCQFENFISEYKWYFYQLPRGIQEVMKNTFFTKLPNGWDKAVSKAKKLLLEKNQIVDSLGGRVEAVRQLMRTRCLNVKLDKEAKKFNFDYTCYYNFRGVLKQYDCNKPIKTQNKNTHGKRGSFHKQDRPKSKAFVLWGKDLFIINQNSQIIEDLLEKQEKLHYPWRNKELKIIVPLAPWVKM